MQVRSAVLLIHGREDRETPAAHSERVLSALAGPKRLILVEGVGHNQSLLRENVWTAIDAWIEQHVKSAGAGSSICRTGIIEITFKMSSIWKLRLDIVTAKILVWTARVGRDAADLTADTHLYFYDRYQRLANDHKRRGNHRRALHLQAKADEHYSQAGGDGPPYAAAMGMPRPSRWISTDAVSRHRLGGSDDAA